MNFSLVKESVLTGMEETKGLDMTIEIDERKKDIEIKLPKIKGEFSIPTKS